MSEEAFIAEERKRFHALLLSSVLTRDARQVPTNADKDSPASISIANGILDRIGTQAKGARLAGQRSGNTFEKNGLSYIEAVFHSLSHLRPGKWQISRGSGARRALAHFDQYEHLEALDLASKENPELAAALGSDYLIRPDIVITRLPEDDGTINQARYLIDAEVATYTSLRSANQQKPILHASVSCKWTLRSDRAQNARSEALNLVRNRKGRLPHIVVITGEPTPSRIASIALGTGDIDCVYHFALHELQQTISGLGNETAMEMLDIMVQGKRLRDISDLPFDLVV